MKNDMMPRKNACDRCLRVLCYFVSTSLLFNLFLLVLLVWLAVRR